jgi:hypothetical protein
MATWDSLSSNAFCVYCSPLARTIKAIRQKPIEGGRIVIFFRLQDVLVQGIAALTSSDRTLSFVRRLSDPRL